MIKSSCWHPQNVKFEKINQYFESLRCNISNIDSLKTILTEKEKLNVKEI